MQEDRFPIIEKFVSSVIALLLCCGVGVKDPGS